MQLTLFSLFYLMPCPSVLASEMVPSIPGIWPTVQFFGDRGEGTCAAHRRRWSSVVKASRYSCSRPSSCEESTGSLNDGTRQRTPSCKQGAKGVSTYDTPHSTATKKPNWKKQEPGFRASPDGPQGDQAETFLMYPEEDKQRTCERPFHVASQ